jgi:hypothetical protein
MTKLWAWIRDPLNLAVLVAIAGGLAWLWNEFGPSSEPAPTSKEGQVATAGAGTAVAARDNADVRIGDPVGERPDEPSSGPANSDNPPQIGGQTAIAKDGGTAVTASGDARVSITGGK